MAVRAERLHQRHAGGDVEQRAGGRRARRCRAARRDGCHAQLLLGANLGHRDPERRRDVTVEPVFALEQGVHRAEERPRLGTLDDPVIVGAADGHHLRDAQLGHARGGNRGELGREGDRADRDDAALADHQARHRGTRAEATRVGERHRGAGEVVGKQLVDPRLLHQAFVGPQESGEIHGLSTLDDGHHQPAAAVLPGDIHGEARG